ncbi:hypothetical protein BGZ65_003796, partial [Modicella reniformis]
ITTLGTLSASTATATAVKKNACCQVGHVGRVVAIVTTVTTAINTTTTRQGSQRGMGDEPVLDDDGSGSIINAAMDKEIIVTDKLP